VAPEGVERKLAAIVSADVMGYSRLMAEDEATTIRTLREYREQVSMLVRQRRGGGYSESGVERQPSCSQD
jgi:class 3 adenylate cyclase